MANEIMSRVRYGEAFWRAHHEAWGRSELNQRDYCEAHGIPLKAFGNWRAKFKAEPQAPERKLLYRRSRLSHTLSHSLSHSLSHMTYGSPASAPRCAVDPARQSAPRTRDRSIQKAALAERHAIDPRRHRRNDELSRTS